MPTVEKQGYKYTEKFGYIPDDWEVTTLGQVGNVSMCKRIMKDETKEMGEVPFYKIGTFGSEPDAYISKEIFETYKNKYSYPKEGDILISAAGTIGRTVVFDGKPAYFQDSNIVWLQHNNNKVLNKYLYYVYKTNPWYTTTGGTIARLYNENITKATILKPPVPEQEKIAEVLGDVDSLIDKTQQLINKKKDLKTATMQKLLTPKEDWEIVPLSKYAYVFIGLVTTMTTNYVKNGVPLIRNSDIKTNKINKENLIQLDSKFAEEYNNRKLKIGDIVTVHTGDVGTSAIIDKSLEGAIGFATLNTRVDKNKLLPQFLCWYFNSEKFITECLLASTGDGRQNLNLYDFIEFNIPVPPLEEQLQISDTLNAIHAEIENLEKELNKYKDLKTGMMQQLLTGKVRLI